MFNKARAKLLSFNFKFIRRTVIVLFSRWPKDLERAITIGDSLNHILMISPLRYFFKFKIPKNIHTKLYNLSFPSPLIAASFKDDISSLYQWQLVGLGGMTYKTVLKRPSEGNKRPRIQEIKYNGGYGLINSLGLPTKGVEHFANHFQNKRLLSFNRPIGISIGGNRAEEYLEVFNTINSKVKNASFDQFFYELNISCPNTDDGKCLSDDMEGLLMLLNKMRESCSNVIVVKVSPDSTQENMFKICETLIEVDSCAINLGNTKYITAESVGLNKKTFSKDGGGVSGVGLFETTLRNVELIASNFDIPIIATGGISTYKDVRLVLEKGATLVGMASQLVIDPFQIPQINSKLSDEK
jgi:dihydroorotate dehydrogenase (NAD+) catalytic subunit